MAVWFKNDKGVLFLEAPRYRTVLFRTFEAPNVRKTITKRLFFPWAASWVCDTKGEEPEKIFGKLPLPFRIYTKVSLEKPETLGQKTFVSLPFANYAMDGDFCMGDALAGVTTSAGVLRAFWNSSFTIPSAVILHTWEREKGAYFREGHVTHAAFPYGVFDERGLQIELEEQREEI